MQLSQFHFCLHYLLGSTLKGENLLLEEQILSIKSRSILVGFLWPAMQTESYWFSFFECGGNHEGAPVHLKRNLLFEKRKCYQGSKFFSLLSRETNKAIVVHLKSI